MKRSELPLLFPGIVLLLAAAAYALLFFTSRAEDVPSAVCTAALWQDTLSLKGVVSRGETPVSAPEGAVYPLVPDGERVAAGAPVALAGETGAELFRAALHAAHTACGGVLDLVAAVVIPPPLLGGIPELSPQALRAVIQHLAQKLLWSGYSFLFDTLTQRGFFFNFLHGLSRSQIRGFCGH